MSKIAIVYARQSTADQVANNIYSTQGQLRLREQALRDGFEDDNVLVIDEDLGVSGRTIMGRVGMVRALKMMDDGLVSIVYVEDMTRLSRDGDTVDHMRIAKHCRQSGVLLYMAGSLFDMRNSGDRQSFKYQAVGASESWSQHMEKLQRAQRMKAEEGRVASCIPRYGYRVNRDVGRRDPERDKLVVNEPEAAIIRALADRLLEAGSLRELFRQISPTVWPDGMRITFRTMAFVLKSPLYRGHYAWGDVLVEDAHEAIISAEQAAAIDRLVAFNKTSKRRDSAGNDGVLVGLTWCPACERVIYGSASRRFPEYRCALRNPVDRRFHFSIDMPRLDEAVVADLWRQLDADLVGRIVAHLEGEKERVAGVADFGDAHRRTLQRRIEGLTRSLSDPDITDSVRKLLLRQLDDVARETESAEKQRPTDPHLAENLRGYRELAKQPDMVATLVSTWQDEPLTWRRSWLRRFVGRVEVVKRGRSSYDVAIHYLDGQVAHLALNLKRDVAPEEWELVKKLWSHPKRPARGWAAWIAGRLVARGYQRVRVQPPLPAGRGFVVV